MQWSVTRRVPPNTAMPDEPSALTTQSAHGPRLFQECWIARLGLFMAVSGCNVPDFEDARAELVAALERDSRVVEVGTGEAVDPRWCSYETVYEEIDLHSEDHGGGTPPSPADHRHSLQLSAEITLRVSIPEKNQPNRNPWEVFPEHYVVKWDGTVAAVFWRQPAERDVPMFAGQVVEDVLRAAARGAGLGLLVQRCSAECSFSMLHRVAKLMPDSDGHADLEFELAEGSTEVIARISSATVDFGDIPDDFYSSIVVPTRAFAEMKNLGQRLIETEHYARHTLRSLLGLNYARFDLRRSSPIRSLPARWRMRGWRRDARREIAGAWLAITDLELLRHEWSRLGRTFQDLVVDRHLHLLFASDHEKDAGAIADINVSSLVAAIEQLSVQLDTSSVVRATAWGALAGGAAGGVIGAAVNLL